MTEGRRWPEPFVEVRGVRFSYGSHPVLDGVSLRLDHGELVALLGANGSGKTTLLRLLSGTLTPGSGRVTVGGRRVDRLSRLEAARSIALLPQSIQLPAGFRVSELVAMGRAPHATSLFTSTENDHAAVRRALVDAGAAELADRHPGELSGGERQRVLVAMALAQEPRLLLLDEPTLHLDLAHQLALLESVVALQRTRGVTVVAVFHDLNLASSFAPRVVVLDGGRIAGDGEPAEVLTPEFVERVFGVAVAEARTAEGERFLAPRRALSGRLTR